MNNRQEMIRLLFILWGTLAFGQSVNLSVIRKQLRILEKENYLSGVVLIAKGDKTIYKHAFGYANMADKIPNKANTKFNLASMNKMFTGLAIMQLAEKGKLSLHDKVGKYLPDFPNKLVADSVTIHQLLTHTSGMGNFWAEQDKLAKEKFKTVSDYLPLYVHQELLFSPGKGFQYSNSGYMVLGLIIEKVSGLNYFDYVRIYIFEPAKMKDTDSYDLEEAIPNMATGYTMLSEKPGQWKNNMYSNVVKGTPAGGGYSTAEDLLRFSLALQQNMILGKEFTKLYSTGKVQYKEGSYAYGIVENFLNGQRMLGHTGGHFGIANELMIFPESGYTVVILTNGEVENYWQVSNLIKKQLTGSTNATDNFFYTKDLIRTVEKSGLSAGIKKIEADSSKKYILKENLIERYGQKFLFEKKYAQAIDLFQLSATQFPDSATPYYNLSEAYRLAHQKEKAIEALKIYLKREPLDKEAEIKYENLKSSK
ncbi:serine hydrolase [Chryseobacterium gleum]|uniref:serine hydrolase n=1 Tax=Chryseobacterium gleum TaxID=250 RepID=UPI00241F73A1|nr:serine hydrolase [Chryseobacterium gleum]